MSASRTPRTARREIYGMWLVRFFTVENVHLARPMLIF